MRMPPYGCSCAILSQFTRPACGPALQPREQRVDEIDPGLDGDDWPGSSVRRNRSFGKSAGGDSDAPRLIHHVTADVVHLQAEQVPEAVREERKRDCRP